MIVYATWLASALRAEGCRVAEVDGWQTRSRPASTGAFDPYGVTLHHTGTTTSAANPCPTLGVCVNGRGDLPGPLCHVLIGYDGLCHVVAAGRANHAGTSNGFGPFAPGDGNAQTLGIEIDYSGSQAVSSAQGTAAILAAAAMLRRLGQSADYCVGHKETSTDGKWDPGRYGPSSPEYLMAPIRQRVAAQLAAGTAPPATAPRGAHTMIVHKQTGNNDNGGDGMYLLDGGKLCGITGATWNAGPRPPIDLLVPDQQQWNRMVANFGKPVP